MNKPVDTSDGKGHDEEHPGRARGAEGETGQLEEGAGTLSVKWPFECVRHEGPTGTAGRGAGQATESPLLRVARVIVAKPFPDFTQSPFCVLLATSRWLAVGRRVAK